MTNRELAAQIIQQAEEAAERRFQEVINEILPRELASYPKDEHQDYYRRKLQELRKDRKKNYRLYLDVEKHTPEQLAGWIKVILDDLDSGLKPGIKNPQHAVFLLKERLVTSRYIRHLVGLLDGQPEAKTPKAPAKPAAELGEELPQVVREALAARGLLEGGRYTGKKWQVRNLFEALAAKGYLDIPRPSVAFSAFFQNVFGFYVSEESLRKGPKKIESQQREAEERKLFKAALSKK